MGEVLRSPEHTEKIYFFAAKDAKDAKKNTAIIVFVVMQAKNIPA